MAVPVALPEPPSTEEVHVQKDGIIERNGKFRAEAYDRDKQRRVYRTFPTRSAAKAWRRDMQVAIARGELSAVEPVTVREAWARWIEAARKGVVRARGGAEYKPGVLRTYELAFEGRLLKRFGHRKVGELRRSDVQRYIDDLVEEGLAAQTTRNMVNALRVLMKWAIREELRRDNPCDGVELPAGGSTRDRIAPPTEAIELLRALDRADDRAIMATAFFAGLRRGELMALRWCDVDIIRRTITVHAERGSYDPRTKTFGPPKSKKGARTLGIPELLVPYLLALDSPSDGLVFARDDGRPFNETSLRDRALPAWGWREVKGGGKTVWIRDRADALEPIGLHEARHTYASLMIAAGVNIKTISEWMGHSSVNITLDRYGHLLPGSAKVALGLLNDYLDKELSA
jgi:integrase